MPRRIILDTNVVSEIISSMPNRQFARWMSSVPKERLFITAITFGELMFGVCALPDGRRKRTLQQLITALSDEFIKRTYDFNASSAVEYGDIYATRKRMGRPTDVQDAQIAAIARANDCIVATRNVKDFEGVGVPLVNPWEPAGT